MKRYYITAGCREGDTLEAADGEWILYTDHIEAMKRIAGAPVAQGLIRALDYAEGRLMTIDAMKLDSVARNDDVLAVIRDARAILAQAAPSASATGGDVAAGHFQYTEGRGWTEVQKQYAGEPGVVVLYHEKGWPARQSSASAQPAEPVLIQRRMRPTWRDEGTGWTEWQDCTADAARDCERTPIVHDWQHEVRRLYAAPAPASPAALTDAQIIEIAKSVSLAAYPDETVEFARALLAASPADQVEDARRLDWMAEHEAWIAWTRDGEGCRVFHCDDEGDSKPFLGWGSSKYSDTAREAIDAAMSASKEGA